MAQEPPGFTGKELTYLRDTDFLKTKRELIKRFIGLFGNIQADILKIVHSGNFQLPGELKKKSGKITRGENYKELPFVVLDCPAFFSRNDIFAYRSMFWWGNYLSNHFLVKGYFLDSYREQFFQAWPLLKARNLYLDRSDDPWNHDLSSAGYLQVSNLSRNEYLEIVGRHDFLKFVWRMELNEWKGFHKCSIENFLKLAKIMASRK